MVRRTKERENKFRTPDFFGIKIEVISNRLLFQKKLNYEANILYFNASLSLYFRVEAVYLRVKEEAMKDFDAMTEFSLCVFSARRTQKHALCSLARKGFDDVFRIVRSFLVPPKESL